jgi:hypothetical protein
LFRFEFLRSFFSIQIPAGAVNIFGGMGIKLPSSLGPKVKPKSKVDEDAKEQTVEANRGENASAVVPSPPAPASAVHAKPASKAVSPKVPPLPLVKTEKPPVKPVRTKKSASSAAVVGSASSPSPASASPELKVGIYFRAGS